MRAAAAPWLLVLPLVAAVLVPTASLAGPDLVISPSSETLTCLIRPPEPLVYPSSWAEPRSAAVVRARLRFETADKPPAVEIFYNSGQEEFEKLVKRHLDGYRLPCLAAGAQPVTATQEFVFSPEDGRKVHWSPERTELSAEQQAAAERCISFGKGRPIYPMPAFKPPPAGVVLASIRFDAIDAPPLVQILYGGGSRELTKSVSDHVAQQYRLSCVPPTGLPIKAQQSFVFTLDGEEAFQLKDMSLRDFVGALKGLERTGEVFDFAGMNCPFEVEMRMYRPHAENSVGEVGGANANRREFIEWLKKATLNLRSDAAKHLVGASTRISVPCGRLDLS